ncbi:hypothetical protein SAMN05421541_114134 [Actinoplanes philippinensis]|uniref:Uncharacterized protein n=1 Tax=Actinoplanes philippinensis TaxID=35752 RepID=A0A1I2JXD6_9ACTN|nr:hypothetical protein SAMN05421541_114134 [Actinoplanes philippinensis]
MAGVSGAQWTPMEAAGAEFSARREAAGQREAFCKVDGDGWRGEGLTPAGRS